MQKLISDRVFHLILLADSVLSGVGLGDEDRTTEFLQASRLFLELLLLKDDPRRSELKRLLARPQRSSVEKMKLLLQEIPLSILNKELVNMDKIAPSEWFSFYLDMAESLLKSNYKDSAVMIIGSVLEEHLRALCRQYAITTDFSYSGREIPKKPEVLLDDLVEVGAYNSTQQHKLAALCAMANQASFAQYHSYNALQVENMLKVISELLIWNKI